MTQFVWYDRISCTMYGVSTITQKGQVVIPADFRRALGLKPSTRVSFSLREQEIVVKPVLTLDRAFGMVTTKRRVSEREYKKAIRDAVAEKFNRKRRDSS